jgi:hypothetical protein
MGNPIDELKRFGLDGILDRLVDNYYSARPAPVGGVSDKVRESARTARSGRLQITWGDARAAVSLFACGEATPIDALLDRLRSHKDALTLASLAIVEAIAVIETNPGSVVLVDQSGGRGPAPRRVWPDLARPDPA